MTANIDTSKLPDNILRKAVTLRNCIRQIYIALYSLGAPSQSSEIAKLVGHSNAYVDMRLNQLVDMGLAKKVKSESGKNLFELI